MEKLLFDAMVAASEKKNQLELQLLIAAREYKQLQAAYKAYIEAGGNDTRV